MSPGRSAPPLLQLRNVAVAYDGRPVLRSATLSLVAGEVVALVGANGGGKSTLLRCIMGQLEADGGDLIVRADLHLGYLPQSAPAHGDEDPRERVEDRLWQQRPELGALRRRMLAGEWELTQDFQTAGGYDVETALHRRCADFAVDDLLPLAYAGLSPGERRKVDLVALLVAGADLLLLDEPVNFLDLEGMSAFEKAVLELRRAGTSTLLVSHDRDLVDNLADRTLLLERGRLVEIGGGYSQVLAHRAREQAAQRHRADVIERKLHGLERDMRRRKGWAVRKESSKIGAGAAKPHIAKQAKKMMKRAKEVERRLARKRQELERARPRLEPDMHLVVPSYEVPRRTVARLASVRLGFAGRTVLDGLDLTLQSHRRIALLGGNGAGKSTLLLLLSGDRKPDEGVVERNPAVRLGHVTQELDRFFSHDLLLPNFLGGTSSESHVRTVLGSARLRRERVLLPVASLSHGERMRAAVVKLMLERTEFLLLDEPTTHLDLESIEVLERLLRQFSGGFLLVSHDRRLVRAVCDDQLVLKEGRIERV